MNLLHKTFPIAPIRWKKATVPNLFSQNHILMTLPALGSGMAHVTASEVVLCCLCVAVFPGISHPVSPRMGNGLLAVVAVRTVGCRMTNRTKPAIVGCILSVLGSLPVEDVIPGLLGLMTVVTKSLWIVMAKLTGLIETAGWPMLHCPVAMVTLWWNLFPDLGMTDFAIDWGLVPVMTLFAGKHIRPLNLRKALLLVYSLVTRVALHVLVGLVSKYKVNVTLGLFRHRLFNRIIVHGAL